MVETKRNKDMLGRSGLISVPQALEILLSGLKNHKPATEIIPLTEAFDRVLGEAIVSPQDLPAEARSTMDGFAVRAADTFGASQSAPCYLNITGEVRMGEAPKGQVEPGACHKIPTGGLLPPGADSVVMFEQTVPVDDTLIEIVKSVGSGSNVIGRGEDIGLGEVALAAGRLLRPQDIGLLAGLGISSVTVAKKIRVGILATGDEIIPHSEAPQPGQIRNINSLALAGQVLRAGGLYTDYPIVSDRKEIFLPAIQQAIRDNDIVLFSGGSSVGVRDLGEQVIEELGPPGVLVHGVTLKPGKPVLIGMSGTTPIFGLPGHPVSAMVCFDFFVRPAMEYLCGMRDHSASSAPSITARLSRNLNSAPGRLDVVRVKLTKEGEAWTADPILGKSGSISTLSRAHGYFLIDEDSQGVTQNSMIQVYLYS
ncbi:MAG: molybdopterin molybdotransferase MoeA [Desulforhopalus sp.]|nr:molybdopterin molybdotransferase MoeA [Desulforhopalus sp.]